MKNEERLNFSKKGHRVMTEFFTHELVFDDVRGNLDHDRKKSFEEYSTTHPEIKIEMENIRWALQYVDQLSSTRAAPSVFNQAEEPETYLSSVLKRTNYRQWPLTVKWAIEAMIVLAAFLFVLIIIPWDQALKFGLSTHQREVILAEVPHPLADRNAHSLFAEDESAPPTKETPNALAQPIATRAESEEPKADAKPATKSAAVPTMPPAAPQQVAEAVDVTPAEEAKSDQETTNAPSPKPVESFLYRGTLRVLNLDVTTPKIRDKIVELGGHKAGEVELGWAKTPHSTYFHFTLPEGAYDELVEFLGDYGDPQIIKEKHPRVMPKGMMRLIITVEEEAK